jgi:hypothetical protein
MTKAALWLKIQPLVDEKTACLIEQEINTLHMRNITRVTKALQGDKQ